MNPAPVVRTSHIEQSTRIKSASSLRRRPILRPICRPPPPLPSPSTFPLSAALNLRYLSLSGIHYRFYWGQSRPTDRPTEYSDGGNEADERERRDGRTESEWIMPATDADADGRASIPCRRRPPLCRAVPSRFLSSRSRQALRLSLAPLHDGSRPDL